jgi:hypothetical protein
MARSLLNRTAVRNQIECGKNHNLDGFGRRYRFVATAASSARTPNPSGAAPNFLATH